jgi:hypothetical protein
MARILKVRVVSFELMGKTETVITHFLRITRLINYRGAGVRDWLIRSHSSVSSRTGAPIQHATQVAPVLAVPRMSYSLFPAATGHPIIVFTYSDKYTLERAHKVSVSRFLRYTEAMRERYG